MAGSDGGCVLTTRPEGARDPLAKRLRGLGYRVHAVPTVVTAGVAFDPPDLTAYDWVVVTSATGARELLSRTLPPDHGGPRWAAVGPRTAAELERLGLRADAVPDQGRGILVAEAIASVQPLGGLCVLLARADTAARDLPEALRAAGARPTELAVYQTVEGPESSRDPLNRALADPALDSVVFASGSAVRGLLRLAARDPRWLPAVTIGPSTSEAARREGFRVLAEATSPSVDGLLAAVERARGRPPRAPSAPSR